MKASTARNSAEMVSRLRFKGDPKGKVVKNKTKTKKSHENVKQRALVPQLTLEDIETSWTTSSSLADSYGPVMLCLLDDENNVRIVNWNDESLCTLGDDFGVNEHDQFTPWKGLIHTVEPLSPSQVMICSPVLNSNGVTLKASRGKYLAKTGHTLSFNHAAIDTNCIFKVDFQDDGTVTLAIGEEHILATPEGELELRGSGEATRFVLRVQMRNTVRGKRMIEELSGKKDVSSIEEEAIVNDAVQSLMKYNAELNDELVKRLEDAHKRGRLNEQLIEERTKLKSDSRC